MVEYFDFFIGLVLIIVLAGYLHKLASGKIHHSLGKSILVFAAIIFSFCIINICGAVLFVNTTNPEKELDFSYFEANSGDLKDFEITNGRLKALTEDPWISYHEDDVNSIRTATINVNYMSKETTSAQLIFTFGNGVYSFTDVALHEGVNEVVIEKENKTAKDLRFDLTNEKDFELGIDSIILNKRSSVLPIRMNGIFKLYTHIIIWLLFIFAPILTLIYSKKIKLKDNFIKFISRFKGLIMALLMLATYYLSIYSGAGAIIPVMLAAFCLGQTGDIKKEHDTAHKVLFALIAIIMFIILPMESINHIIINPDNSLSVGIFISALLSQAVMYSFTDTEDNKLTVRIVIDFAVIYIMTVLPEILANLYLNDMSFFASVYEPLFAKNVLLNTLLLGVLFYFVKELFGEIIGRIVIGILYFIFIVGSFVKMKFHNTIFSPIDLLQVKDFMSVVTRYVPAFVVYGLAAVLLIALIAVLYKKRKTVFKYKPHICMAAVMCVIMVSLAMKLEDNDFENTGADFTLLWAGAEECVNAQGVMAYSYVRFNEIFDIMPKADENYNEEYMTELKKEIDGLHNNTVSDVKPNVILIMEESMMDVSRVPDINISMNVDDNIKKYKKAMSVSPKYGGLTSVIEFEALTGFSDYFFLDTIVPYITYWDSKEDELPSIAEEFNKNGYNTTAIHPNEGNVYNRDVVYSAMGFKNFIDRSGLDFSSENVTADGYFKDSVLADVIEQQLNSSEDPQFIFTVTIENHMLYDSKYNDTEVKVTSDKVSGTELHQLEQYTQGVLNADRFIEKMVNIVDNSKRPTIMYVWGDHLPPLAAFNTLGYINDKYNKYTTPIVAYSNYKDINIDSEYISPAQLAPQLLRDAGIDYSSYFDFIYSLREKYPVVHKEFGINPEDEAIKKYGEVQYDVLFGKHYLLDQKASEP